MRPLLLWLLCLPFAGDTSADELAVAVAGNFLPALEGLSPAFERATGHRLRISAGSTGKLYAQIRQGAPYDVFLAADRARPERLEAEALTVSGTRFTYAVGQLVLWAPEALPPETLPTLLRSEPPPRLAIANPRLAPYGAAAEAWLRREGLWTRLAPRAVRGESVAQAFHFVASGNAPLGLVARSQWLSLDPSRRGAAWGLPADAHPPIEQQAVLLRDVPAGRAFLDWLGSAPVRARLEDFGYRSP